MTNQRVTHATDVTDRRHRLARRGLIRIGAAALGCSLFGPGGTSAPDTAFVSLAPAIAQSNAYQLPGAPADGVIGFVVNRFVESVIQGNDACPEGHNVRVQEYFLATLPPDERERIQRTENQAEFMRRFMTYVSRPDGSNMCTQYALYPERPTVRTVQSKFAWGLNLDDDDGDGSNNPDGCAHENFTSPDSEKGIDNQAYRALGCKRSWRGIDGIAGDIVRGYYGFLSSGEWTQVLLLRGVDSLVNDDDVEVIYANTPDRPVVDTAGKFVWNASFTISDKPPRERNVLRGRIVNGVLMTEPAIIKLTQTWGQSARIDNRGIRNKWTLHKGRLRLSFQPDGTLKGVVGGYQPIDELVMVHALGGLGNLRDTGVDCAGEYNTLKELADGIRDPKTGQCTAASTGLELAAVPAFVNDVPGRTERPRVASR